MAAVAVVGGVVAWTSSTGKDQPGGGERANPASIPEQSAAHQAAGSATPARLAGAALPGSGVSAVQRAHNAGSAEVSIRIDGLPAGATLLLDGEPVSPPLALARSTKARRLEVTGPRGGKHVSTFVPDRDRTVTVALKAKSTPPRRRRISPKRRRAKPAAPVKPATARASTAPAPAAAPAPQPAPVAKAPKKKVEVGEGTLPLQ